MYLRKDCLYLIHLSLCVSVFMGTHRQLEAQCIVTGPAGEYIAAESGEMPASSPDEVQDSDCIFASGPGVDGETDDLPTDDGDLELDESDIIFYSGVSLPKDSLLGRIERALRARDSSKREQILATLNKRIQSIKSLGVPNSRKQLKQIKRSARRAGNGSYKALVRLQKLLQRA
jgi:hypothetical protein